MDAFLGDIFFNIEEQSSFAKVFEGPQGNSGKDARPGKPLLILQNFPGLGDAGAGPPGKPYGGTFHRGPWCPSHNRGFVPISAHPTFCSLVLPL